MANNCRRRPIRSPRKFIVSGTDAASLATHVVGLVGYASGALARCFLVKGRRAQSTEPAGTIQLQGWPVTAAIRSKFAS
jgi:hypothetical protein